MADFYTFFDALQIYIPCNYHIPIFGLWEDNEFYFFDKQTHVVNYLQLE